MRLAPDIVENRALVATGAIAQHDAKDALKCTHPTRLRGKLDSCIVVRSW